MTAEIPGLPLSQALLLPRIAIEDTMPVIDAGAFAVKAVQGQSIHVTSKVFADGHDQLAVLIRWRSLSEDNWHREVMADKGNNTWEGTFDVTLQGPHQYCIEAWIDHFASFCYELGKKHTAGVPVSLELQEGRQQVLQAAERSEGELQEHLQQLHQQLSGLLETEQVALFLHEHSA
jgi:starch synthase (maltosyl-transferring)